MNVTSSSCVQHLYQKSAVYLYFVEFDYSIGHFESHVSSYINTLGVYYSYSNYYYYYTYHYNDYYYYCNSLFRGIINCINIFF